MEGKLTGKSLFVADPLVAARRWCQPNVRDPLVLHTCPKKRIRDASLVLADEASPKWEISRACRRHTPSLLPSAFRGVRAKRCSVCNDAGHDKSEGGVPERR